MRLFYCYICFSSRLIFFPSLVDLQEATVICSICISAVQPNLLLMPTTQDTQTHIWEVVLLAGGRPGCRGNCRVRSPATAAPELGLITAHPPRPNPHPSLCFFGGFFSVLSSPPPHLSLSSSLWLFHIWPLEKVERGRRDRLKISVTTVC